MTEVMFGPGFEGPPGLCHGGIISAVYDDLLGFLIMLNKTMAFTRWLRVDYTARTPVGLPLRFEAWIDRFEGKKLFLAGECRNEAGEALPACESLLIDVDDLFAAPAQIGDGRADETD